jgi:hypothetical protein
LYKAQNKGGPLGPPFFVLQTGSVLPVADYAPTPAAADLATLTAVSATAFSLSCA